MKIFIFRILLLFLLLGCESDPIPTNSVSITNCSVSSIDYTSAVIQFTVLGNPSKVGILYGTDLWLSTNTEVLYSDVTTGNIFIPVCDLRQGTEYYYKVFVEDKKGNRLYGNRSNFITNLFPVITGDASNITTNSVTLSMNLNVDGAIETGIIFTTDKLCENNINKISVLYSSKKDFSFDIENLISGTTYYYRAYIKFEDDTIVYGEIKLFSTEEIENWNPEGEFILSTLAQVVPSYGKDSCYFAITTTSSWTVESDQTWCKVQTKSGSGEDLIYYSVEENDSSCRIATLTIKDNIGEKQLLVLQDMKNNPIQRFCYVSIYSSNATGSWVMINTPTNWNISTEQDWCIIEKNSGNPGDTCYLEYTNSKKDKVAILTLKSGEYVSYQIHVKYKEDDKYSLEIPEIEMVKVDGGNFLLNGERQTSVNDFYIGKYEVTQREWTGIMGYNNTSYRGGNLPVGMISFGEIQKFINKLNEFTGKKYRLPTNVEWEFAARGGNKSKNYIYSGSNDFASVGWRVSDGQTTVFVGRKQSNELGIYDMTGNVGECCLDVEDEEKIVVKGYGGYGVSGEYPWNNNTWSTTVGFRLVLDN